jgi:hypothetical protein
MANRGKFAYIAGFITIGWIASAALIGFFLLLAHFVKSTAATVNLVLVIVYSCLFGVLGSQVYTWKGRRDGWPPADTRARRPTRKQDGKIRNVGNTDDDEAGWKRSQH